MLISQTVAITQEIGGYTKVNKPNRPAVNNSTNGYCQDIGARQVLQRARKNKKLKTGTKSSQVRLVPQAKHCDLPPKVIPVFIRNIATFKKLPTISPKGMAIIHSVVSYIFLFYISIIDHSLGHYSPGRTSYINGSDTASIPVITLSSSSNPYTIKPRLIKVELSNPALSLSA